MWGKKGRKNPRGPLVAPKRATFGGIAGVIEGYALSVSLRLTAPPKGELRGARSGGSYLPLWGRWHGEAVTERANNT